MCACVHVCVEDIILKLGTVTVSVTRMHHMLIILTLTFIQSHTDRKHENNKCLIISETNQAMPITFAVKIVRLKVYMTTTSPMTVTFIQGHKCVSNVTTFFYLRCIGQYVSYYIITQYEGRRMDVIYMLMLF